MAAATPSGSNQTRARLTGKKSLPAKAAAAQAEGQSGKSQAQSRRGVDPQSPRARRSSSTGRPRARSDSPRIADAQIRSPPVPATTREPQASRVRPGRATRTGATASSRCWICESLPPWDPSPRRRLRDRETSGPRPGATLRVPGDPRQHWLWRRRVGRISLLVEAQKNVRLDQAVLEPPHGENPTTFVRYCDLNQFRSHRSTDGDDTDPDRQPGARPSICPARASPTRREAG